MKKKLKEKVENELKEIKNKYDDDLVENVYQYYGKNKRIYNQGKNKGKKEILLWILEELK